MTRDPQYDVRKSTTDRLGVNYDDAPQISHRLTDKSGSLGEQIHAVPVNIPSELADRISSRLPGSDFGTVDDYVSYVMGEVLDELESNSKKQQRGRPGTELSKEDEENVEQRLRDLGYM